MSETKFKVGDRVRVIAADSGMFQKVGVVKEVNDVKPMPYRVEAEGSVVHSWFTADELEPAPAVKEAEAPQSKFKAGDRVRVIAVESAMYKMIGYVKRYDEDRPLPYHVESLCMNWDNRFTADELEPAPVIKESLTVDNVNNPPHYNQGGIECIDAIKAATGSGFVKYCTGNVIKYLWRYDLKGGVEDLKKAAWYLDRAIKEMEVTSE